LLVEVSVAKAKKKIRKLVKREHPCWGWCGQKLFGIAENLKVTGEASADFEVEVCSAIGPMLVPAGALQLTCQHNRLYIMVKKSPAGDSNPHLSAS
jgi:hypothetical protein